MIPAVSFILSLAVPILPWISLSPWWVTKTGSIVGIWSLLIFGILLDIWWAKPLGGTSLILAATSAALYFGVKAWPASYRSFSPVALVTSFIIFELYLLL